MDIATLRIDFIATAFTMLVLFYLAVFRVTRSLHGGWWCVALIAFPAGTAAHLLDATSHQVWAGPLGTALLTLGVTSSWATARTLRTSSLPRWVVLAGPVLVGVMAALDDPATNAWAGAFWHLLVVAAALILGSVELVRLGPRQGSAVTALVVIAAVASTFSVFRLLTYLAVGPRDAFFVDYAGIQMTTLASTVLLVAVSCSLIALSTLRSTTELRRRATHDGLTDLLNHSEFLLQAAIAMRRVQATGTPGTLTLADLDHFKQMNDAHGHQAGDEVLRAFAAACLLTVRPTDLVGRYGGEEYVLFLSGSTVDDAADAASGISRGLASASRGHRSHPTASYGIAGVGPHTTLVELVASADAALYRSKDNGRDRFVIAGRR